MPPKVVVKSPPKKPPRAARGAKPIRGRGRLANFKSRVDIGFDGETKIEDSQPENKPKRESWLDKLPPVIKEDEELHQKLSKERRIKRHEKVARYCRDELAVMLNFALKSREITSLNEIRKLRAKFLSGDLEETHSYPQNSSFSQIRTVFIDPKNTIDIESYISLSNHSVFSELSNLFGVSMSESHLNDPNKIFAKLLSIIEEKAISYMNPYTPEINGFPFIICITGPLYSGKTTVCQLLQKVFDIQIIEVVTVPPSDNSIRRRRSQVDIDNEIKQTCDFRLTKSFIIQSNDEKGIPQMIAQTIKDSPRQTGWLISGFPTSKSQIGALEKALSASQNGARPTTSRSGVLGESQTIHGKKSNSISGLIFTNHTPETYQNRFIDPVTGNIYSEGFHTPGIIDLIGISPTQFTSVKSIISSRIQESKCIDGMVSPKLISQYNQLESSLKKAYMTLIVPSLETSEKLAMVLDEFVQKIFESSDWPISTSPLLSAMLPDTLLINGMCFEACKLWKQCFMGIGKEIADQYRLVSSLSSKINDLSKSAEIRFQLLCSRYDDRIEIANQDFSSNDYDNLFNQIWDKSISIRDQNMIYAKKIVALSGLFELLAKLMISPQVFFVSLVNKLAAVQWFSGFCERILNGEFKSYDIYQESNDLPKIPSFNFGTQGKCESNDSNTIESCIYIPEISQNQRKYLVENQGTNFLYDCIPLFRKLYHVSYVFDFNRACESLGIPSFQIEVPFENINEYAECFISEAKNHFSDNPIMIEELNQMKYLLSKVFSEVKTQEKLIINSVFDLFDNLKQYAYSKCGNEMELFSRNIQNRKKSISVESNPFIFDLSMIDEELYPMARWLSQVKQPLMITDYISIESIQSINDLFSSNNQKSYSIRDFMKKLSSIITNPDELFRIECIIRVSDCSECFRAEKAFHCYF